MLTLTDWERYSQAGAEGEGLHLCIGCKCVCLSVFVCTWSTRPCVCRCNLWCVCLIYRLTAVCLCQPVMSQDPPSCSWVMLLNNGRKGAFAEHYDVKVKLTFHLLDICCPFRWGRVDRVDARSPFERPPLVAFTRGGRRPWCFLRAWSSLGVTCGRGHGSSSFDGWHVSILSFYCSELCKSEENVEYSQQPHLFCSVIPPLHFLYCVTRVLAVCVLHADSNVYNGARCLAAVFPQLYDLNTEHSVCTASHVVTMSSRVPFEGSNNMSSLHHFTQLHICLEICHNQCIISWVMTQNIFCDNSYSDLCPWIPKI